MAVPNPGKCLILLVVLAVILYTGYAFRIRDAVSPGPQVRSDEVCSGLRCPGAESARPSSLPSMTLGPATRRKLPDLDLEADKGRRGKVVDKLRSSIGDFRTKGSVAKEPEKDEDDGDEDADEDGKTRFPFATMGKWRKLPVDSKKKFGRLSPKIDESPEEVDDDDDEDLDSGGADEDDLDNDDTEEIDADADEDEEDDGVEISDDTDGSEEVVDDDDDDDVTDEENLRESDESAVTSREKREFDDSSEGGEEDTTDSEEVSEPIVKTGSKLIVKTVGKPEVDINGDSDEISLEKSGGDGIDEDIEKEKHLDDEIRTKKNDEPEKSLPSYEKSTSTTPKTLRKLEKVRLADKEKAKSLVIDKPVARPVEPEVSAKKAPEPTKKASKNVIGIEESRKTNATTGKIEKTTSTGNVNRKSSDNGDRKSTKIDAIEEKSTLPKKKKEKTVTIEKNVITGNGTKDAVKTSEKSKTIKKPEETKKSDKIGTEQSKNRKPRTLDTPAISLAELNDAISHVPTFVPNFTAIEDPLCQRHGKIFLRQLRGYKLWALQMLDSSGKISSGMLRGNINQFGDFDQCLGITARVKVDEKAVKIQGKYCLASVDLEATIADMKVPANLLQSRSFIRASMRDPGHFVPRFTTANWAICIPAACSANDAKNAISNALSDVNVTSGLRFNVDVDPDMCYVRQKSHTYSKETIGVLYFYAIIIGVVVVATVRDFMFRPQEKGNYSERIIMSFSLRRSLTALTKEGNCRDEISCVHGLRSLATITLYVAHKIIPTAQIPYANRISLTEITNYPASSLLRTSLVYTDCFLLLSGLLTAFNMARETSKRGEIRWFLRLVTRFIRLSPVLLVTVFWYAYVMEHTGTGPQWNRIIGKNADLCKQNSWTNLLYIQNFFPFEEMCATQTHQLALDMQLSLIAPILVFFLLAKPIAGILIVFFLLQLSATLRYFATANNHLSLVIFHGMTMRHLYKTANLTYILTLHRATPYIFGVCLGVLLHYTGRKVRLYKFFVIIGWVAATILALWCLFSPWKMARRDYVYDVEEATQYAVITPVAWSLALSWIIFACFTDHGGVVNKLLSSYWMILFSRISYAVYLCQFAIFFHNVGTARYSSEFQIHRLIDPYEAALVMIVSTIVTLLVDIPMQEVKKVVLECGVTGRKSVTIVEEPVGESAKPEVKVQPEATAGVNKKRELEDTVEKNGMASVPRLITGEESYGSRSSMEKWRSRSFGQDPRSDEGQAEEEYDDEGEETISEEEEDVEEDEEDERSIKWRRWLERDRQLSMEDDGLVDDDYSDYRDDRYRSRGQSVSSDYQRRTGADFDRRRSADSRKSRERSLSRSPEPKIVRKIGNVAPPMDDNRRSTYRSTRDKSVSRERENGRSATPSLWERSEKSRDRRDYAAIGSDRSRKSASIERSRFARDSTSSSRELPNSGNRRIEPQESFTSGSDDEYSRRAANRFADRQRPDIGPADEEEEAWERELRLRRRKFMEKLAASEERNDFSQPEDSSRSVTRRSSAEGKIALLKDAPASIDGTTSFLASWSVSRREPGLSSLGNSQETDTDTDRQRKSAESYDTDQSRSDNTVSGRNRPDVVSIEEDEDFARNRGDQGHVQGQIIVMDMSDTAVRAEPETTENESEKPEVASENLDLPRMATLKLFKRESIVKSQASEEDPEYLLPERPKLLEQEQDHPFKKAWQLQKSRSAEDETSPYALPKDFRPADSPASKNRQKIEPPVETSSPTTTTPEINIDDKKGSEEAGTEEETMKKRSNQNSEDREKQ